MLSRPRAYLGILQGNAKVCILCHPFWSVPFTLYYYYLSLYLKAEGLSDAQIGSLMVAGTDSIHYGPISDHIFKFSPIRANNDDLKRFHGTNERLSTKNYLDAIRFYHRLITEMAALPAQ